MSGELRGVATPGSTVYANIIGASAQRWNGSAFETYNASNWSTYRIAMTEQGSSGVFIGTFPAGILTAGDYTGVYFLQSGGSAAEGDPVVGKDQIPWDGSDQLFLSDVSAKTDQLTFTTTNVVDASATISAGQITSIASAVASAIWAVLTSTLTTAGSIGKFIVDNLTPFNASVTSAADSEAFYTSLLLAINVKISDMVTNPQVDYRIGNVSVSAGQKMNQLLELRKVILQRIIDKPSEAITSLQDDFSRFGEDLNSYIDGLP